MLNHSQGPIDHIPMVEWHLTCLQPHRALPSPDSQAIPLKAIQNSSQLGRNWSGDEINACNESPAWYYPFLDSFPGSNRCVLCFLQFLSIFAATAASQGLIHAPFDCYAGENTPGLDPMASWSTPWGCRMRGLADIETLWFLGSTRSTLASQGLGAPYGPQMGQMSTANTQPFSAVPIALVYPSIV